MKAVVIGAGSWGTAFACLLRDRSHDVTLAARDPEQVAAIRQSGRNPRYAREADLSGIAAALVEDAPIESAELVVVAVPSRLRRGRPGRSRVPRPCSASRRGSTRARASGCRRWSRVDPWRSSRARTSPRRSPGSPAAAVVACADLELAVRLPARAELGDLPRLRQRGHRGVELCAAAKNVIALAAGGADGLGSRTTRRRRSSPRGCGDAAARGGGRRTPGHLRGLAGMGDLIVTCWSPAGRNRRAGELIAQGATAEEARAEIGMVVEGLTTAPVLRDLPDARHRAADHRRCVCRARGVALTDLVEQLMRREPTTE